MAINYAEMDGAAEEMVTDPDIAAEVEAKAGPAIISKPEPVTEEDRPKSKTDPTELSVEQLRYLLEQKLLAEAQANEEKKTFTKPPSRAPGGMLWVFNRSPKKFEWQYNGLVYEIEGHSMQLFMEKSARHGKKRSLLSLDPLKNTAVFSLALFETDPIRKDGKIIGEKIKDPKFGVPLKVVNRMELIDRSSSHVFIQGSDGRPVRSTPRMLHVDGVEEMMSRRPDNYAELE